MIKSIEVGKIGNYYGSLIVKSEGGRFFWAIEDYYGEEWEEISEGLYNKLLEHNKGRLERDND